MQNQCIFHFQSNDSYQMASHLVNMEREMADEFLFNYIPSRYDQTRRRQSVRTENGDRTRRARLGGHYAEAIVYIVKGHLLNGNKSP